MKKLHRRILDLSYKLKLSHIGSCLTSVDIIDSMYDAMKPDDRFILSNGHAGLALYVVLEKYGYGDAEELYKKHGTHPNRDTVNGIHASTGSLGQGLPIAVGTALAKPKNTVYCLISDGEMAEGSMWEALRFAGKNRMENLRVACVANGYSAYDKVDSDLLDRRLQLFFPTLVVKKDLFDYPDWLQGLQAHYHIMTEEQYKEVIHA